MLMLNLFAHSGHSHDIQMMNTMSSLDHCMPIIIGAGIIIAILLGILVFMLTMWQPKEKAGRKQ